MSKIDLHTHSAYSDGSDDEYEYAQAIIKNGIEIVALADHDEISGCDKVEPLLPDTIKFLPAIEFSCVDGKTKYHILGYGYDKNDTEFLSLVERGKELRRKKLESRLHFLKETYDIVFPQEDIDYLRTIKSVGRPHIAEVMVKNGLADSIQEAIAKYLRKLPSEFQRTTCEEAIHAILHAGGIPVWAHPLGGEGDTHLSEEELEARLTPLLSYGLQGLECYYSRYDQMEVNLLCSKAKMYQLLVSGGSDYHGKNKDIPLGTLNNFQLEVTREQLTILSKLL